MFGTYRPDGEIDLATAQSFDAELRDAIDSADEALVVVDCSRVTFMDTVAYHALARATEYTGRRGHTLVIRRMSPSCERLLRLCDPDHELHVDPRSCAGLKSVDSSRDEGPFRSTILARWT
jgi:anti-anti-sigma factor